MDREKFFKATAQLFVKEVGAFFKYFTEKLEQADSTLKKKQIEDFNNQEKIRIEAQRKLDEEAESKRKIAEAEAKKNGTVPELDIPVAMVVPAESIVRTEQGTTSFRKQWTFEILVSDQVPREYCEPVDKLIREAVRSGQRNIPGVKIFEETVTTRR